MGARELLGPRRLWDLRSRGPSAVGEAAQLAGLLVARPPSTYHCASRPAPAVGGRPRAPRWGGGKVKQSGLRAPRSGLPWSVPAPRAPREGVHSVLTSVGRRAPSLPFALKACGYLGTQDPVRGRWPGERVGPVL